MTAVQFDAYDRAILRELQADGRLSNRELAGRIGLSPAPCWRRVRQLEDSGVITGYHARLDRKLLGYGVLGFVHLAMHDHTPEKGDAFEREVMALPQILSCHNLSGRFDYQLEVVAQDLEAFAEFVRNNIRGLPGVREISTSFSLKEVKRANEVPVD